ncbi:hypothetical protein C943_04227 [Mariniradius saccharolyticus AK6]|uniref:S1 motif domain-containing protein n=1 Tax=Mariniradius saccharolyticus AK6 TaxID=1239962 RepID=M7XHA6_9BACT|nr:hypothetical protein [Mariniradius saccharolyticus]EMS33908.1 hypothetical protein C943_04227 [Mariniradius saccharolyticus AK6]
MIRNLEHKANDEKYFKSIRYFSHSLKGDKRREFIELVAEYNIYLAAQCIMSAEKDEDLEKRLIGKAEYFAQNFLQPENSAKGFLALAEFESLKTIVNLFSNIKHPNNAHLQVISKIFENRQPDIFCSFLSIFTKTDKTILIQFAINTYNGELPINNQIKDQLNLIFKHLLDKKLFGLLDTFIEKFKLHSDFSYILGDNTENIIRQISNEGFNGLKLGFKLAKSNELLSVFTVDFFIKKAAERSSKKSFLFAITTANKYNVKKLKQIDFAIERALESHGKSGKNKIKAIGKHALLEYSSENPQLSNKVLSYYDSFWSDGTDAQALQRTKEYERKDEERLIYSLKNLDVYLDFLFEKNKRIPIERQIYEILNNFDTNLIELSHKLRRFELQGTVKHILDYGCYVKPSSFRTEKLLFLHKNQITEKTEVNHPNEFFKKGALISFRIIGINRQNHRLNISCLDSFKPENHLSPPSESRSD